MKLTVRHPLDEVWDFQSAWGCYSQGTRPLFIARSDLLQAAGEEKLAAHFSGDELQCALNSCSVEHTVLFQLPGADDNIEARLVCTPL